jgi:hypothetical protein
VPFVQRPKNIGTQATTSFAMNVNAAIGSKRFEIVIQDGQFEPVSVGVRTGLSVTAPAAPGKGILRPELSGPGRYRSAEAGGWHEQAPARKMKIPRRAQRATCHTPERNLFSISRLPGYSGYLCGGIVLMYAVLAANGTLVPCRLATSSVLSRTSSTLALPSKATTDVIASCYSRISGSASPLSWTSRTFRFMDAISPVELADPYERL